MDFVPGLVLCRRFHEEVVGPAIRRDFPDLRYAAARLDTGSELFGLDTPRSIDHDWGARVQVFVGPGDADRAAEIGATVGAALPPFFLGYPTRFAGGPEARLGVLAVGGERHGVQVLVLDEWLSYALGFDPRSGVTVADWMAVPTQRLAEVTAGAVFHDELDGALGRVRAALAWYPDDVWRYVLAAQWTRVAQEEHFVGRCMEVGDELGSLVVVGRLARDLMRLCLLLRRCYPPYGKWLGSRFAQLPGVAPIADALRTALGAGAVTGWPEREAGLARALEKVADWTNETGLAEPLETGVRRFHDRPFLVLDAGRFAAALRAAVTDPVLRARPLVGAVDQFVDNTDVLGDAGRSRAVTRGIHPM
ncbi:uncharacterized protein DUF4037 [Micromonospora pisi]|uniref:Uncharacterized protein DUF4037 n=1 Tax=Micromonospora pisi TaxID=589240 RepID=A0A495JVP7_9ACTN|nr:DUF4037 domain-containing protein [Micromonospora pisi]RKR92615.1 uncharacterized protein DUF4037 [Micromonospora pisi]